MSKTLKVIQEAHEYMREKAFFNKLIGGENVLEDKMERYEKYIKPLLKREGKITAKQIKSVCGFKGSNVYIYLNELIDKGYLVKESDPKDGRKSYYKLLEPKDPLTAIGEETFTSTQFDTKPPYPVPIPQTIEKPEQPTSLKDEDTCYRLKTMIINDMNLSNQDGNCINLHLCLLRAIQVHSAENEEE